MQFRGVTPHLYCWIDDWQVTLNARYRRRHWDQSLEYDVMTDRTQNGRWFCKCCGEVSRRYYYKTPERLWVKHSFEPMLARLAGLLVPENVRSLHRWKVGTEAVILHRDHFHDLGSGELVERVPLFTERANARRPQRSSPSPD